jgi:hypothetical protein
MAKNARNILSQFCIKKEKKHDNLVNDAKLGGTTPLTKTRYFFSTRSRHAGEFLAPWTEALCNA